MERITKKMLIGDIMNRHPETRKVFIKHFGGGCFTCPGAEKEDVYFGSTIHNVKMSAVLDELNDVVAEASRKRRGDDG